MAQVAIAYSLLDDDLAVDKALAWAVAHELGQAGFTVWLDPIPAGEEEWSPWIDARLRDSFAQVVIATPAIAGMDRVTYLWAYALGLGLPVIPLATADTDLHPRLAALDPLWCDGERVPWEALIERLCAAAAPVIAAALPGDLGAPYAVREAIRALGDPDPGVRTAAVAALAGSPHPAGSAALFAALEHPVYADVRRVAVDLLGRKGSREAVPLLVAALADPDMNVVEAAQAALTRFGPPVIPALAAVLTGSDRMQRRAAVFVLAAIGTRAAVPGLITVLKMRDWLISRTAAVALGRIGDARAIPELKAALHSEDDHLRDLAAQALAVLETARGTLEA